MRILIVRGLGRLAGRGWDIAFVPLQAIDHPHSAEIAGGDLPRRVVDIAAREHQPARADARLGVCLRDDPDLAIKPLKRFLGIRPAK